jgi:hypothetical protein
MPLVMKVIDPPTPVVVVRPTPPELTDAPVLNRISS